MKLKKAAALFICLLLLWNILPLMIYGTEPAPTEEAASQEETPIVTSVPTAPEPSSQTPVETQPPATSAPSSVTSAPSPVTPSQPSSVVSVAPPAVTSQPPAATSKPAVTSRPVQVPATSQAASEVSSEASSEEGSSSEESSSEGIVLPEVTSDISSADPFADGTIVDNSPGSPWYGIVAWVCIGLAAVLVLAVLFSNVRSGKGSRNGSGRSYAKYRNHPKRKHLLDDKYYRNTRDRY